MFTAFQKNITIVLAAFGLLLFAIACKKEKDPPLPVQDDVTIEIQSPEVNTVLHAGESLHIHVIIKSPVTLHGYSWKLTDKANGSVLAEQDDHTHEKELTIHEHWDWEEHITEQTEATLEVTAIVDHDGKTSKKSVDITFQP